MKRDHLSEVKKDLAGQQKKPFSPFNVMVMIMFLVVVSSVIFLSMYKPSATVPAAEPMTLDQKMAQLNAPLAEQQSTPNLPWWMLAMILSFVVIQIIPLLIAAKKAHAGAVDVLSVRAVREIEFLAETPLHLGLLGSLLGVCMTHFLTGTLAAPLAYFTTISGILLYLLGRFMILVSLPTRETS